MKKYLLFAIIAIFIFSSSVLATSTIDYNFSIDTPIYKEGENVFGEKILGTARIGTSFQKSYGKVSLGGEVSSYPLVGKSEDLLNYASIRGSIDWFEAGRLGGSLSRDTLGISYSDNLFGNENLSATIENKWYIEDERTTQRLSLSYKKKLPNNQNSISINASWNVENLKKTQNASISASYNGSFHYMDGNKLNTSIIGEVYDKDGKPIEGVTIRILVNDKLIKRVKTSQGGTTSFGELEPGDYKVQLLVDSLPEEYELVSEREKKITIEKNQIEKVSFEVIEIKILEKTTFNAKL